MHELGHILGFSIGMIPEFINPETGYRYGNNVPIVVENIRGHETYVLTTPVVT